MSTELRRSVNRTIFGNVAAKSVFMFLGDEANREGYSFSGPRYIATCTEVKLRTVMRLMQVFEEIGLISKVDRGRKNGRRLQYGTQISLEKLGSDLSVEFEKAYARAQGNDKRRPDKGGLKAVEVESGFLRCRCDLDPGVAATGKNVAPTKSSVAATLPPDLLIGVPICDPLVSRPPNPRDAGDRGLQPLPAWGVEKNRSITLAADQAMQGCVFTARRLRKALKAVIEQECDKGEHPSTTALAMIAAWKQYKKVACMLRFTWGPANFFSEGHWRDQESWPWDNQVLREQRLQAEARVGAARFLVS